MTRSKKSRLVRSFAVLAFALALPACDKGKEHAPGDARATNGHEHEAAGSPTPTNRVDIPQAVRLNLGITFARVEIRNVARTLRVPGRFELLPTARREYRTPLGGHIELLVKQFQKVEAGTPLYRVDGSGWRELRERIASTRARVESMGPLREAHKVHEKSLADKVQLWQERLVQLEQLRQAGSGNASQFTDARDTLNSTQAELADVMEKDAQLRAEQLQTESELRSLEARRDSIARASSCGPTRGGDAQAERFEDAIEVCAVASGVVETLDITPGGLVDERGLVLTTVRPEEIRFRARALQSDMGQLREGLAARIVPPQGDDVALQDSMAGPLQIGLTADADERTLDLLAQPETLSRWARAGVSAQLEITLAGGSDELAIPLSAVVRDGATPVVFRRDPANPDKVIRLEADVGLSDGRWIVIASGVKEGDEVVLGGSYQLMLATSGSAQKGGHFHPDGTFHDGEDK